MGLRAKAANIPHPLGELRALGSETDTFYILVGILLLRAYGD